MKHFLLPILLVICIADLWGQKHSFGINAGFQEQSISGIGIDSGDERLIFVERNPTQVQFGVYYRHQLDEWVFLEVAPSFYRQNIQATYSTTFSESPFYGFSQILITTTNLYFPVMVRLDLGYNLSFTAGAGSILLLEKKKLEDNPALVPVSKKEQNLFNDLFDNLNNWPINMELGLSYGLGRFSINGKYIYRASKVFDDIAIEGKNYPIDFKTDAFQIDLSYRISK